MHVKSACKFTLCLHAGSFFEDLGLDGICTACIEGYMQYACQDTGCILHADHSQCVHKLLLYDDNHVDGRTDLLMSVNCTASLTGCA